MRGARIVGALAPRTCERHARRLGHAQPRRQSDVAQVAADRGRGAAGAGTAHDPRRLGEALLPQLADDRLGDVVVAAPVGGELGQAELVEEAGAARGDFPSARLLAGIGAGEFAMAAEREYGLAL